MSCDCYKIGGPWISFDPDCPVHGLEAQRKEEERRAMDRDIETRLKNLEEGFKTLEEGFNDLSKGIELLTKIAKSTDSSIGSLINSSQSLLGITVGLADRIKSVETKTMRY